MLSDRALMSSATGEPTDAIEPVPPAAERVFGARLPLAVAYARMLATEGVERGLIGPREGGRIWTRHLLNSAVVAELIPADLRVIDVGSGAGLPGIPLALARPDLRVTLLEPLQRRVTFLEEMVSVLRLPDRVSVVRGRAQDEAIRRELIPAGVVVARAVAPLDRVVRWCLPLVEPGGWLLALKGERASDELAEHRSSVQRSGASDADVVTCGQEIVAPPTAVIRLQRGSRQRRASSRR